MRGIEVKCIETGGVRIYLPDKNSNGQHLYEIAMFLSAKDNELVKNICKNVFANVKNTPDYQLFISMWTMAKFGNKYNCSVAFYELNLWNLKMRVQNDRSIVFVDKFGKVVLDKPKYTEIAKAIRGKIGEIK